MSKKGTKQPRPWKYYARDCRGRFIKKSKKTAADLAEGIERFVIEPDKPQWMYVQLDTDTRDFYELTATHESRKAITTVKTAKGLSMDPKLKTWKILVSGPLYRKALSEDAGVYHVDVMSTSKDVMSSISCPETSRYPLYYAEVSFLREHSGAEYPLGLAFDPRNEGPGNIGSGNAGINNFGYWNKGIRVMGVFNTKRSSFYMFDKPCEGVKDWTEIWGLLPDFLKETCTHPFDLNKTEKHITAREAFNKAAQRPDWHEQYIKLTALPNFDFEVFEEITGISKESLDYANDLWAARRGIRGAKLHNISDFPG